LSRRYHNSAATRRHPVTCPDIIAAGRWAPPHLSKSREHPPCGLDTASVALGE
jgi:hypothetical protein